MNTSLQIEDIMACVRAGRKPREHGPYRIMIGDADLSFNSWQIDDPVPTGRQLLQAAGARPAEEHVIFQVLKDGELEELRLDETIDLRTAGVERFIMFRSAASFRLELDSRVIEWGAPAISGRVLKRLAGVNPKTYGVWLEVRGAEDRPIDDCELVRLDTPGLERFFTGTVTSTEGSGERVLPVRDRRYLEERGFTFREVSDSTQRGVIISGYALPEARFQVPAADILILLPRGYPDARPDMFYAVPWLTLSGTARFPRAADQPLQFDGQRWQRWSRHSNEWRPGTDGIWTMLKRVDAALAVAA